MPINLTIVEAVLDHPSLSNDARLMLLKMLCRPVTQRNGQPYVHHKNSLQKQLSLGRDRIEKAAKELRREGFMLAPARNKTTKKFEAGYRLNSEVIRSLKSRDRLNNIRSLKSRPGNSGQLESHLNGKRRNMTKPTAVCNERATTASEVNAQEMAEVIDENDDFSQPTPSQLCAVTSSRAPNFWETEDTGPPPAPPNAQHVGIETTSPDDTTDEPWRTDPAPTSTPDNDRGNR